MALLYQEYAKQMTQLWYPTVSTAFSTLKFCNKYHIKLSPDKTKAAYSVQEHWADCPV